MVSSEKGPKAEMCNVSLVIQTLYGWSHEREHGRGIELSGDGER